MKQSSIDTIEKYRYVKEGRSFSRMPGHDLGEVLAVIHSEFDPGYKIDWYCDYCVMKMVDYAFAEMEKRLTTVKINLNGTDSNGRT